MVTGDVSRIDLGTSSFERMITEGMLYVDKTRLIEHFLVGSNQVHLIARQRRLGKSLNIDTLRCFLTVKEDLRHLFKGLYVEKSPVWSKAHSAPVFAFDFKTLTAESYKRQIAKQIDKHICSVVDPDSLKGYFKRLYTDLINNPDGATDGLLALTEIVYEASGKRSYILIDEYDKLLMDNYDTDMYDEIRDFETALLTAGLKGNHYLEKALLTGVMRISHESMFSGLNNIVAYDVFNDDVYTDDYGLTDDEVDALSSIYNFDIGKTKDWYNGIRIDGHAIYNIYSVLSFLARKRYDCYWGKSGAMHLIAKLLNDSRRATLARLINGEQAAVSIANRISLRDLSGKASDQAFYSLLVQSGYLALCGYAEGKASTALVSIPNIELMMVWKEFILEKLYTDLPQVKTLFDNADNLELFSKSLEYFLCDRLSYHDLATKNDTAGRLNERLYHIFLLGILSAYDDSRCHYPLSNRESGDGRYDILVEKPSANFIFEFKACASIKNLGKKAQEALEQIDAKRYGADLGVTKRLVNVGIAFHGKVCKVQCSEINSFQ